MKKIILIIILLFSNLTLACDCDVPKPIMEFYHAAYVFEGTVATKVYNSDYDKYSIAFKIDKHYKYGDEPNVLRFTFKSGELHTDELSSCDWNVEVGEKWLVYAYRNSDGNLTFNSFCSNSKRLDFSFVSKNEQAVLDNGNDFVLEDYIYESEIGFTEPKPITSIDSIIKLGVKKNIKILLQLLEFLLMKRED